MSIVLTPSVPISEEVIPNTDTPVIGKSDLAHGGRQLALVKLGSISVLI